MHDRRSPLKDKPLRNPGQSVREQRTEILFDKLFGPMLAGWLLVVWASFEWWRYFFPTQPQPVLFTVIALFGVAYATWQFRRFWPKVRELKLAEEGEKAVGQYLERLRESGYHVFHDVVGPSFNVDHVIIGPAGVFTIETKTWKKPLLGNAQIQFDGENLTAHHLKPDRDPIVQAKAQAGWLKQLLADSTGKMYFVRPVILFPGWYIEARRESQHNVWVLEPKALPAFLEQVKNQVTPEDQSLASFHLSRFIRQSERTADN